MWKCTKGKFVERNKTKSCSQINKEERRNKNQEHINKWKDLKVSIDHVKEELKIKSTTKIER